MENITNYKSYFINSKIWREKTKLTTINEILKTKAEEIKKLEDWEKRRKADYLTEKQAKLLFDDKITELKKILKKYKAKAILQLEEAKAEAIKEYEKIKELKGIKKATFEIAWNNSRGVYGYQCKCISNIEYTNGTYTRYESEKTTGCGYDKPSSALSYNLNKTCKILLIKNDKKILNDTEKHYKFYPCENMYFSYGVGINSYLTMFKNLGFKTECFYHSNDDITITIKKGR